MERRFEEGREWAMWLSGGLKTIPGREDNQCKDTLAGMCLRFSRSSRKALWLQQRRSEPGEVRWDQALSM